MVEAEVSGTIQSLSKGYYGERRELRNKTPRPRVRCSAFEELFHSALKAVAPHYHLTAHPLPALPLDVHRTVGVSTKVDDVSDADSVNMVVLR